MGAPGGVMDFAALPIWMRKVHCYDLVKEWGTFVGFLKSARKDNRVPFMAPDLPNDFVSRPNEFDALLSALLDRPHNNPVASTTALQGAGGFGKTTLAAALCHHEDVITAYDDGILWATLGQAPKIQHELTKLYAALTGERPSFIDADDAAIQLAERLDQKNCLIVIDDVWDTNHVKPFLRGGKQCARLITTRRLQAVTDTGARRISVGEMTEAQSVQMLTAKLASCPIDLQPVRGLARRLGEWPLLLKLAASQLRERMERGDLLENAMRYLTRALDKRGPVAFDRANPSARNDAVASTVAASLDLLCAEDRQRCIELAIFPEDKLIPLGAIGALWGIDDFDAEELIQRMDGTSLIDFELKTGCVRIHDVLHAYFRSQLIDVRAVHGRLVRSGWPDPYALPDSYAWRWYGWHLVQAGEHEQLRSLLWDFRWLDAMLRSTEAQTLLQNFDLLRNCDELRPLRDALRLASHVLARDPLQLAAQLRGRLERGVSGAVERLLEQAAARVRRPWLRLIQSSLTHAGGAMIGILKGHSSSVEAVAMSCDDRYVVSGSGDWTLRVWDFAAARTVRVLAGHSGLIHCVAITQDGKRVVSGSEDRTLRVWDLETGQVMAVLKGHSGAVCGIAITPRGRFVGSISDDRTVRVWDLIKGRSKVAFTGYSHQLRAIASTPDGRHLIFAPGDETILLMELGSGRIIRVFVGHAAIVKTVAVSADGRRLLSGSGDRTLRLWDMETGETLGVFEGHENDIDCVALTRDGHWAVSGSQDQTLRVWDLNGGGETRNVLEGHASFVRSVAVTSDGRQAISGSADKTLRHWNLENRLAAQPVRASKEPISLIGNIGEWHTSRDWIERQSAQRMGRQEPSSCRNVPRA